MFLLSYFFEAIGDEPRLLASLKDAERLKDKLPDEQKFAEVPARMAAALNRMGQSKDAKIYYQQAERGVATILSKGNSKENLQKISQLYFMMGNMSTAHLSAENLQAHLDTLALLQVFLLRSIEVNGAGWSDLSYENLKENYVNIWQVVMHWPENKSMDKAVSENLKKETQDRLVGQILRMVNQLKLYKAPETADKNNKLTATYEYLNKLEKSGNEFLLAKKEINELTPEAKKRQSLKREGTVHSEAVFPIEKKSDKLPEKKSTAPETDPNIKHE
jgi:hypothetical protein